MTDDEAADLVNRILENISDDGVRTLISAAGNRPRVIEQSCRVLVKDAELTIEDAVGGLRFNPRLFFELAEPEWKHRITTYLENLLGGLKRRNTAAAALLELFSLFKKPELPTHPIESLLVRLLGVANSSIRSSIFKEAVAQLQARSLLVRKDHCIRINQVTQYVLQDLLRDNMGELLESVCEAAGLEVRHLVKAGVFDPDLWLKLWLLLIDNQCIACMMTKDLIQAEIISDDVRLNQERRSVSPKVPASWIQDNFRTRFGSSVDGFLTDVDSLNQALGVIGAS